MVCFFFFVKQKTSYEMRISDWSSDVCSSDLDVARIDPDGFLYIVDRTKDVIKSGGEWISSIDLENAAIGHPAIQECAVIAAAHPKWSERPLMLAVLKEGQTTTADEVRAFLADKVAKWWLPDEDRKSTRLNSS